MNLSRILRDNDRNYVSVDAIFNALRVIDASEASLTDGDAFSLSISAAKDSTETYEVRFQTPNSMTETHMLLDFSGVLETAVALYETTTKTHAAGSALTPVNRNRNSSETSAATVCHTPGGAGDGTLIFSETFGAGKKIGGRVRSDSEVILKRNTAYLLRLTSNANNNTVNALMSWYEVRTQTYTTTTTTPTTTTTTTTTTAP